MRCRDIGDVGLACLLVLLEVDSPTKTYGRGGFYFSKVLLCFQPCSLKASTSGSCDETMRFGMEKCCVAKKALNESSCDVISMDGGLEKLARPNEKTTSTDGMKLY